MIRLLARLADALLAPQPWQFESASYDSRRGGDAASQPPPGARSLSGGKPSLAELIDFYCPPSP